MVRRQGLEHSGLVFVLASALILIPWRLTAASSFDGIFCRSKLDGSLPTSQAFKSLSFCRDKGGTSVSCGDESRSYVKMAMATACADTSIANLHVSHAQACSRHDVGERWVAAEGTLRPAGHRLATLLTAIRLACL